MLFHRHKFKSIQDDTILYCECGNIKILPCKHKWIIHNASIVTDSLISASQKVETWICEKCGEHRYVNLTTGETN